MPRPSSGGRVADLILECVREGRTGRLHSREQLLRFASRLAPDNISARPTHIVETQDLRAAIVNPSQEGVRVAEGGVILGGIIGEAGHWWDVGSEPPDGTFVLARYSGASVELLSDVRATRTLWYAQDEDRLVASTSQRAVVALLGGFDLDRSAVSWLLSSGSLGPDCSWDSRVRRLPTDSRLLLDRRTWRSSLAQRPAVFAPVARRRKDHLKLLRHAISWSCGALDIDTDRWLLPLSGGLDSRMILVFMVKNGRRPRCLTWTTRASLRNPLSDAFIARLVARRFGLEHDYAFLDGAQGVDGAALQRFVEVGEGRTDEFAGYVDGCAMWRDLFASGLSGVIRGDDPLAARRRAASLDGTRMAGTGTMITDYPQGHVVRRLGLADQDWPERLQMRPGEGFEPYRDRMSHEGAIPKVLAPLNGLKCRYLEVVNPLLSRRIVALARTFPDELRMYGRAFPEIVDRERWPIPHARFTSTPVASEYLADEEIIRAVVAELTSTAIESVIGEEGAMLLLATLASPSHSPATVRSRVVAAMKAVRVALPSRVAYRLTPRYQGPGTSDGDDDGLQGDYCEQDVRPAPRRRRRAGSGARLKETRRPAIEVRRAALAATPLRAAGPRPGAPAARSRARRWRGRGPPRCASRRRPARSRP